MNALQSFANVLWVLATDVRSAVLLALLVAAAASDLRSYRIPNRLTGAGLLAGVVLAAWHAQSPLQGALYALAGAAVGLCALLPLYMLRMLGAGDVKLMAMTGAFLGTYDTLYALVFVLATGGAVALAFAVAHRVSGRLLANVRLIVTALAVSAVAGTRPVALAGMRSAGRIPYALSICLGTAGFLVARQAGLV
jgi:prepilin peptidase CpaA